MKTKKGFALPTVMITSVVMLGVLLFGLVYTSTTSVTVRDQYYDQLAREAAESGVNFLIACVRANTTPVSGSVYTPQSTSCANSAANVSRSKYILDTTGSGGTVIRTTYQITAPSASTDGYYDMVATGYVEIYRSNDEYTAGASPIRTTKKVVGLNVQYQTMFPSISATGNGFVCALLNSKTWCWGGNSSGEHGDGTTTNPLIPTQTKRNQSGSVTYSNVAYPRALKAGEIDINGGTDIACAISTNGLPSVPGAAQTAAQYASNTAYCWGGQDNGQLGNGVDSTALMTAPVPVNPKWKANSQYPLKILAANNWACTMTTDNSQGNMYCWGGNGNGQMGTNGASNPQLTPTKVYNSAGNASGLRVLSIAGSDSTACAINVNNLLFCWGDNEWAQTGTGTAAHTNVLIPTAVITSSSSTNLAAYMVSVSGHSTSENPTATIVSPATTAGGGHGCAISKGTTGDANDRDGEIYCWGARYYGATGLSISNAYAVKANPITSIGGSSTYFADFITTSWRSSCALVRLGGKATALSTRQVWCWGDNYNGELGVARPPSITTGASYSPNTNLNSRTPLTMTSTPLRIYIDPDPSSPDHFNEGDISSLTYGGVSHRFCAIALTHNYCWGRNDVGQIGQGNNLGDFTTGNGDSSTDPQLNSNARFYPRRSIFADQGASGLTY